MPPSDLTRLDTQLQRLQLHYIQSHYHALATRAAEQQRSHLDYLEQLVEGEATMRELFAIQSGRWKKASLIRWGGRRAQARRQPRTAHQRLRSAVLGAVGGCRECAGTGISGRLDPSGHDCLPQSLPRTIL